MTTEPDNNQPFDSQPRKGAPGVPALRGAVPPQRRSQERTSDERFAREPLDLAETDRRRHAHRRARRGEHRLRKRVRHPDGGDHPVEAILHQEHEQREEIETERKNGSRKHNRLPRWLHHVPKLVAFFDFGLLLYFFAGITNVNWAEPVSASMAFALIVAAMLTVLAYGFFSFTGHRLRSYKDHSGAVHLDGLDGFTKAAMVGSVAGVIVLATLMFTRMRTEVFYALGPSAGGTALLVALTLAVVNALANFLVIAVHALDGSDQTARLDKLSAAIRGQTTAAHRNWEDTTVLGTVSAAAPQRPEPWAMTYYRSAQPARETGIPSLGRAPEPIENGDPRG